MNTDTKALSEKEKEAGKMQKVYDELKGRWNVPSVNVVPPFYVEPGYLKTFAEFPRRAKPATFGLDQVMDKLEKNATQ